MREEDRLTLEVGDVLIAREDEQFEVRFDRQPFGEVFMHDRWVPVAFGVDAVFLVVDDFYRDDEGRQVVELVSLISDATRFKFRSTAEWIVRNCEVIRTESSRRPDALVR